MDSPNSQEGFTFSTPLKLRLVAYFRTYYDLDIKNEEADLYLRSLARVYDALAGDPRLASAGEPALERGDQTETAGTPPRPKGVS